MVRDRGGSAAWLPGGIGLTGGLTAKHFDGDGKLRHEYDLGSGKVNVALAAALAKDFVGTTNNKQAPILAQLSRMFSGTSSTTEQPYDYALGAAINIASAAITPTLSIVASSNNAAMTYVGTIAYTGTNAVVEWGLFGPNANGSQYNTATNTITATTLTPGTGPGWTTNQWAPGYIVVSGTNSGTPNSTTAGTVGALIESNTATALTIAQASNDGISYFGLTGATAGAGATPANNTRFDIWPFMADHKTFAAINVVNGDSIQFTYTLTIQSGG